MNPDIENIEELMAAVEVALLGIGEAGDTLAGLMASLNASDFELTSIDNGPDTEAQEGRFTFTITGSPDTDRPYCGHIIQGVGSIAQGTGDLIIHEAETKGYDN